jgi:nucleoside-diphosphate-sugar epimerase
MEEWTVGNIPSLQGKLAVITGANSGIGWHTALELARAGSEVILTARTEAKGGDAVDRIRRQLPQARVRAEVLDLASLRSVRTFAATVGEVAELDLLINNAGVMSVPNRQTTEDGFELQFGTNFLGPFALTMSLMPALMRASSPRVTTVSSGAANMGLKRINMFQLKGDPVPVPLPKPALDEVAACRLWEISEKLTGVAWRVGESARGFTRIDGREPAPSVTSEVER